MKSYEEERREAAARKRRLASNYWPVEGTFLWGPSHDHCSHYESLTVIELPQVENAREASLKGPHSFPLERMLAIFWRLLSGEEEGDDTASLQSADIFMQTSSLVSLRLLSKVGTFHQLVLIIIPTTLMHLGMRVCLG